MEALLLPSLITAEIGRFFANNFSLVHTSCRLIFRVRERDTSSHGFLFLSRVSLSPEICVKACI
jgi:hypothetical protein